MEQRTIHIRYYLVEISIQQLAAEHLKCYVSFAIKIKCGDNNQLKYYPLVVPTNINNSIARNDEKMHETIMLAIMKAYFNYFDYKTNDFFNAESKTLMLFKRCHQINSIFK